MQNTVVKLHLKQWILMTQCTFWNQISRNDRKYSWSKPMQICKRCRKDICFCGDLMMMYFLVSHRRHCTTCPNNATLFRKEKEDFFIYKAHTFLLKETGWLTCKRRWNEMIYILKAIRVLLMISLFVVNERL